MTTHGSTRNRLRLLIGACTLGCGLLVASGSSCTPSGPTTCDKCDPNGSCYAPCDTQCVNENNWNAYLKCINPGVETVAYLGPVYPGAIIQAPNPDKPREVALVCTQAESVGANPPVVTSTINQKTAELDAQFIADLEKVAGLQAGVITSGRLTFTDGYWEELSYATIYDRVVTSNSRSSGCRAVVAANADAGVPQTMVYRSYVLPTAVYEFKIAGGANVSGALSQALAGSVNASVDAGYSVRVDSSGLIGAMLENRSWVVASEGGSGRYEPGDVVLKSLP